MHYISYAIRAGPLLLNCFEDTELSNRLASRPRNNFCRTSLSNLEDIERRGRSNPEGPGARLNIVSGGSKVDWTAKDERDEPVVSGTALARSIRSIP